MTDQTYRVNGGHTAFESGEKLEDGAHFEPTDRELELFPTKFELVQGDADDSNDGSTDEGMAGAAEFVDNNVGPIEAAIEAGDADGHLVEVREAENEGENRSTVHDALDARAEEIDEDAGSRPDEE